MSVGSYWWNITLDAPFLVEDGSSHEIPDPLDTLLVVLLLHLERDDEDLGKAASVREVSALRDCEAACQLRPLEHSTPDLLRQLIHDLFMCNVRAVRAFDAETEKSVCEDGQVA